MPGESPRSVAPYSSPPPAAYATVWSREAPPGMSKLRFHVWPPSLDQNVGPPVLPTSTGVNAVITIFDGSLPLTAMLGSLSWFVSLL